MTVIATNKTIELVTPGANVFDAKIHDVTDGSGVNVHGSARGCEIGRCDIDSTLDSNILLTTHTVGGHHVHDVVLRGAGSFGGSGSPNHGIYDSAQATLVERADSGHHSNGHCFSPRWPNAYYQCASHDNPSGHGVFDYSDGTGGMLLIREELAYDLSDWWIYFGPGRLRPGDDAKLGPLSFGLIADHCTLDLRACSDHGVNLQEILLTSWITNSIIITDNPTGWLAHPKNAANVVTTGSVLLSSAQFATYMNPDYTPKLVAGSPLIGGAVTPPPAIQTHWPQPLDDVGRFQTPAQDLRSVAITKGLDGVYHVTGTKVIPYSGSATVTWAGRNRTNALAMMDKLEQRLI